MCGRFLLRCPPESWPLSLFENLEDAGESRNTIQSSFIPRQNIAPTQTVLAVVRPSAVSPRKLKWLRWGLVPAWANDQKTAASMINARAETVHEKPSFRTAFLRRRCLIPADGYYEWITLQTGKQPMLFERQDCKPFCFAGLWEQNEKLPAKKDGPVDPTNPLMTCTIITTGANQTVSSMHDRMPVVIEPEYYSLWLDPAERDTQMLRDLLSPAPDDYFRARPVERVSGV